MLLESESSQVVLGCDLSQVKSFWVPDSSQVKSFWLMTKSSQVKYATRVDSSPSQWLDLLQHWYLEKVVKLHTMSWFHVYFSRDLKGFPKFACRLNILKDLLVVLLAWPSNMPMPWIVDNDNSILPRISSQCKDYIDDPVPSSHTCRLYYFTCSDSQMYIARSTYCCTMSMTAVTFVTRQHGLTAPCSEKGDSGTTRGLTLFPKLPVA